MTRKGSGTKAKLSVTIDKNVVDKINKECSDTGISRSYKIQSYIKKGMVVKKLETQIRAIRKKIGSRKF